MSWYLKPAALALIETLKANPPAIRFEQDRASYNVQDGYRCYVGEAVDKLHNLYARTFTALNMQLPWPGDDLRALNARNADEVLAALFGDPNRLEWAHPDKAEVRASIRADLEAAVELAA